MTANDVQASPRETGIFWTLRVIETGLLASALVGLGLFAWCIVDIVRIETTAGGHGMPPTAWPGVFTFFGSMVLLQVVRGFLGRYRRADGTQRGDARDAAAAATAEVLAGMTDETGPTAAAAEAQAEG